MYDKEDLLASTSMYKADLLASTSMYDKADLLASTTMYDKADLSRLMGKPTICIGENKGAEQLFSAFVFATRIVQFLFYLNPKFQASSFLLCLYRPVCVVPVRKPHCWFSHEAAHVLASTSIQSADGLV